MSSMQFPKSSKETRETGLAGGKTGIFLLPRRRQCNKVFLIVNLNLHCYNASLSAYVSIPISSSEVLAQKSHRVLN